MSTVRMDVQTVVVGGGNVSSLVILRPHRRSAKNAIQLPIRIGMVEASAISMGVDAPKNTRPMTHDLLKNVISALDAEVSSIDITEVHGTTFYARVRLVTAQGEMTSVDARPSDAIALAIRTHAPIYAEDSVLTTAALPDFKGVEEDEERREMARFHDFVEGLSPDDFSLTNEDGDSQS